MASYTYEGTEELYYPSLGLAATPGLIAELDEMPTDGRWSLTAQAEPVTESDTTEGGA